MPDSHEIKPLPVFIPSLPGTSSSSLNPPQQPLRQNVPFSATTVPKVFMIHDFMSADECDHYVQAAEKLGFEGIEWEYAKSYRDCVRVVTKSPRLASSLWSRLLPHLTRDDVVDVRPFGYGTSGVWRPVGVNPCLRFSKYQPGGHFNPHRDGGFVVTDNYRSVYTVMVYLNDGFEGGETKFYLNRADLAAMTRTEKPTETAESEAKPEGRAESEDEEGVIVLQPRRGTAVIFLHDLWHEGRPVTNGTKYIFRTDLMFERIDVQSLRGQEGPRAEYAACPEYKEAERLYQLSINLQKNGDPTGSTQAYLQALEIHAKLPSLSRKLTRSAESPSSASATEILLDLPMDVWVNISRYLTLRNLATFARSCRKGQGIASDPGVWCALYQSHFKMSFAAVSTAITGESGIMDRERFVPIENETAVALARDWKSLYRYRSLAESLFQAVYVDVGAHETKFGGLGIMAYVSPRQRDVNDDRDTDEEPDKVEIGKLPSIVRRALGHYWSAGSGYYEIQVGSGKRYSYAIPQKPYHYQGAYPPPTKEGEPHINLLVVESIIMYLYGHMFEKELSPRQHPLLLAIPPFISEIERNTLYATLFSYLWIPYISLVDSAILTMHAHGCGHGTAVVVSIGALHAWVELIVDGKPITKGPVPVAYIDGEQITKATSKESTTSSDSTPATSKDETLVVDADKLAQTLASWIFDGANATPAATRKQLLANIILTGGLAKPVLEPLRTQLQNLIYKDPAVAGAMFASFHLSENPALDNIRGAEVFISLPTARDSFICIDTLPTRLVELATNRNFTLDHMVRGGRTANDDDDEDEWWGMRQGEWEIRAWKFTMEQIFQSFGRKMEGFGRHYYGLRFGNLKAGKWVDDGVPGVDDPTRFCAMMEGREVKDDGAADRRRETINNLVEQQRGRPVIKRRSYDSDSD